MSTEPKVSKLRVDAVLGGDVWRCSLDAPKGNVLDSALVAELADTMMRAAANPTLRAIVLTAEGANFSFGASVEEHRTPTVAAMLAGFHALLTKIVELEVPVVAAVRGLCLGGGLELVAACHRIVATPDAQLGQPEIRLGVIAPAASALLPLRVTQGAADDLLLSGRSIAGAEGHRIGLVDELAEDPEAAALAWVERYLLPHSASSLRLAARAARWRFARQFRAAVAALEDLYLERLLRTEDAHEGIEAFLAKRKPEWRHR